eukprot:scaffold93352_cov16-Tisochrysis_lutea.AAC.1
MPSQLHACQWTLHARLNRQLPFLTAPGEILYLAQLMPDVFSEGYIGPCPEEAKQCSGFMLSSAQSNKVLRIKGFGDAIPVHRCAKRTAHPARLWVVCAMRASATASLDMKERP